MDANKIDNFVLEVMKLVEEHQFTISETREFSKSFARALACSNSTYCNEMPFVFFPDLEGAADPEKESAAEK